MNYEFTPFVGVVAETDSTGMRCRVRVFGVHNMEDNVNVSDGDLPWAVIAYPVDSSGMHTMSRGTWVHGFFADGDNAQQPVVVGQFGRGESGPANGGDRFSGRFPGATGAPVEGSRPLETTSATINIPGGSNLEKAYNYIYNKLVSGNLSSNPHMHTSAMCGVLMTETYGSDQGADISPTVVNGIGAFGICQWLSADRQQRYRERYDHSTDLANQLDYMWWELMNVESPARRRWLSATNLEDATAGASSFERNECWSVQGYIVRSHEVFIRTYRYAQQVYNTMSPQAYAESNTPSNQVNRNIPQGT